MDKKIKIGWVNTNLITCGGIITNYEYIKELRQRGIEADLYANEGNAELEKTYGILHKPLRELELLEESDVIIANRWEQIDELSKYKGRKIQFVQGNDLVAGYGEDWKERCRIARNNPDWELMGVSDYALENWGRGKVIPNGINERFFKQLNLERDIDALIEGNNEPNKNIDYAIEQAKKDGHQKIVWFGRETKKIDGVENISSPSQEEIHQLYQRSKHFYKYSKSEGFCLPILEAMACGCQIHTHDMGHNFPKETNPRDYTWEKAVDILLKWLKENKK